MYSDTIAQTIGGAPRDPHRRLIAEEVPIALLYNGVSHVVLMATPSDLGDLAIGFSLTDGICRASDIRRIDVHERDSGFDVDVVLAPSALSRFLGGRRRRNLRSFSSCGVCGIETPDQLPLVAHKPPCNGLTFDGAAIRAALESLPAHQTLNRCTGAVHAAAWALPDGTIRFVREDVGRHNALDKLIGALGAAQALGGEGFCIITSRCSYEMVQKAVAAGFRLLVAISAPTALAVEEARKAGLILVALARNDSQTVYVGNVEPGLDATRGAERLLFGDAGKM